MNWIQSILYGLISGITEFLPISSGAHQDILMCIFGVAQHDPVRDFLVDLAMLFSLFTGCKELFGQFRQENRRRVHNYRAHRSAQNLLSLRLVKTAAVPLLIGMIVLSYVYKGELNLLITAVFLLLNGLVLYLPCRMLQGNKDAQSMSVADSWLIGLSGACSVVHGVSRTGCIISVAQIRGADRQKALNWALLLSIPALVLLSCIDFVGILFYSGQINFFGNLLGYLLSAITAGIGGYLSILLMRFITRRLNHICFAYYSWGASLFSFILYLTVV